MNAEGAIDARDERPDPRRSRLGWQLGRCLRALPRAPAVATRRAWRLLRHELDLCGFRLGRFARERLAPARAGLPGARAIPAPPAWPEDAVRVLYLIPHRPVGGAERVDLNILAGLRRQGHRVSLAVEQRAEGAWADRFAAVADEVFVLPDLASGSPAMRACCDHLLVSRRADLAFIRNARIGYECAPAWRRQFPELAVVDLLHVHDRGRDWVLGSLRWQHHLDRRFLITHDLRRHLGAEYGLDDDRLRVVHCGVDPVYWRRAPGAPTVRSELGLPDGAPVVAFVGRLDRQKHPARWLDAAAGVAARLPTAHFVLCGDGPLRRRAEARARHLGLCGRVHFLGSRQDVRPVLAGSDVLLLTSRYEGLPTVVFEALAMGVPVVAADVGGTRECVDDRVGRLCGAGAPASAFAAAVLGLLADASARAAAGRRGIEVVEAEFTVARMQERFLDELRRLLAGRDREALRAGYRRWAEGGRSGADGASDRS